MYIIIKTFFKKIKNSKRNDIIGTILFGVLISILFLGFFYIKEILHFIKYLLVIITIKYFLYLLILTLFILSIVSLYLFGIKEYLEKNILNKKETIDGILISDKEILIKTYKDKKGKYGRYLVEIFYNENEKYINLNLELIQKGFAKEYLKGKLNFTELK